MTKYKIVLVPFPFDDLSSTKVRPAVCLTEPIGLHKHVVLAFITSNVSAESLPTDLIIDVHHPDFGATGLRVASMLQLHRLMTISTSMIRREMGFLSPALQRDVKERLRRLFEL